MRGLREIREGLGIGLRAFAREAGVSVSTLQDTEGDRTPRPATAWKYAEALRKRGVDPNEVKEIRDALGEVFTIPHTLEMEVLGAWELLTNALIRAGEEDSVRRLVDEGVSKYGEEGRRARQRREEVHWQEVEPDVRAYYEQQNE
jgi:transcriptional regulator with XRE-family HTH domain